MRFAVASIFVFLFVLSVSAATKNKYVVFRLDDIQDYWLEQTQKDLMDVFRLEGIPLTVGVIGNYFAKDRPMATYIKSYIQEANTRGFDFEVANHGFNHEDFSIYTLDQQKSLLTQAVTQTLAALYPNLNEITTFIPPYNSANDNTLAACKATGFTAISSIDGYYVGGQDGAGTRVAPGNDATFREWPIGSSAAYDTSDNFPISIQYSLDHVNGQYAAMGFSSVMLHFNLYANGDQTNPAAIADLRTLITQLRNQGYSFTTFKKLNTLFFSDSQTVTPPAAPVTTGKATPVTTGKATTAAPAPVTTGKATTAAPAPVTTGKATTAAPAPVTTAAPAPATTAAPAPVTTAKATPAAPATTAASAGGAGGAGSASTTCTSGYMRCASSEYYNTCNWGAWGINQSCGTGTTCKQSGNYIYCV